MYNGDGQVNFNSSGRVLNQLTQTIGRQVNIHCDTVTMPGRDLLQQEVTYGTNQKILLKKLQNWLLQLIRYQLKTPQV